MRVENEDEALFLTKVRDWLKETKDPRYTEAPDGNSGKIDDLNGACADFCRHMAEVTKERKPSWRWPWSGR